MTNLYYRDDTVELHLGDALQIMRTLPAESVDCVVTSPPHWGLRDYGTATWTGGSPHCHHTSGTTPHQRRTAHLDQSDNGTRRRCRKCHAVAHDQQYGLEPTLDDYISRLRHVSREIGRILTRYGTYWLNLRDSFSYHNSGTGRTRCATTDDQSRTTRHKSLMGIPWRVALELQKDGWIVRNAIIWHKPNALPDPAPDRFSTRYEILFLLTQHPHYHLTSELVREPLSQSRPAHRRNHYGGNKPHPIQTPWEPGPAGKNPGDVWSMPTCPLPDAHCAPFPVDLPRRCITAGCPENGRVLDPFSGSGTTGLAARQLGRFYQGVDLRPDYHDIALRRVADAPRHRDQHAKAA